LPEPPELVRGTLPDLGPRYERLIESPDWNQFEQGVALYLQGHYVEARFHFATMLREQREPQLAGSVQAFMAESALKSKNPEIRPTEIIEQYRTLMREEPQSTNAKRAAWRVGDIYRMEGWYQEALAAYQHALGLSDQDSYDANRALLGLGYALRGLGKWKDSVQALDNVQKHTTDPSLVMFASLGQAHSLYRLGRIQEADVLFQGLAGRWPALFRKDPYALLRYADTADERHRPAVMREQLLCLYNLYPSRPEHPFALAHIADSYKDAGRWKEAKFFYAALLNQYPDAPIAAAARLRFADVEGRRDPEKSLVNLRQTVAAQLANMPLAPGELFDPLQLFEKSARQYEKLAVGSEALFHLAETLERAERNDEALDAYERVVLRAGRIENDPWPDKSGAQLVRFLRPRLEAALKAQDDFELISLFHRHGPLADRLYAGTEGLLRIADAHYRIGFPIEAARLYQSLIRDPKAESFHEAAIMGLGRSYLEQKDMRAARAVFERYRLQFPLGRFNGEALQAILTCFAGEGNIAGVTQLGRQWLDHHPRHEDRLSVLLTVAEALASAKRYGDATAVYETILKNGLELPPSGAIRHADALIHLNQPASALTFYKQALRGGLNPEQEIWAQFQIVRLAQHSKHPELARGGLRALSENDDSLVRRMAAVMQSDQARPVLNQGGR
jgi:tetratricopeptide (TPR) repeat protein